MAFHESALDAIYEDEICASDVEEGEIEDGEYSAGLQPMDVEPAGTGGVPEGEISADDADPSRGETVDGTSGHQEGFEFKVGSGQASHDGDVSGLKAPPARRERRKSKKRRSGKRKTVDVARFVRETCDHLQEKKISLIWALVKKLGAEAVRGLVNEVDVIEKCGGQMTNDKKRRRTPGGVLWNILKGRVQPEVYKEIMSQGNEVLKQKAKEAKETLKRQRMDIDEPASNKRRKVVKKETDTLMEGTDGKQVTWPNPSNKVPKDLSTLTDGPVRDDYGLPINLIQKAWVEGLRKKDDLDEVGTDTYNLLKTGAEVSRCPDDTIKSVEKGANIVDRLRVPIEYSDLEMGVGNGNSRSKTHELDSSR